VYYRYCEVNGSCSHEVFSGSVNKEVSDLRYFQSSFRKEIACFPVKHRGKWVLGIAVENRKRFRLMEKFFFFKFFF